PRVLRVPAPGGNNAPEPPCERSADHWRTHGFPTTRARTECSCRDAADGRRPSDEGQRPGTQASAETGTDRPRTRADSSHAHWHLDADQEPGAARAAAEQARYCAPRG